MNKEDWSGHAGGKTPLTLDVSMSVTSRLQDLSVQAADTANVDRERTVPSDLRRCLRYKIDHRT